MTPTRLQLEIAPAFEKAPPEAQRRARVFFEELVADLREIPEDNAFWDSMQVSMLAHAEAGWSFLYRFDGRKLQVYDVRRE